MSATLQRSAGDGIKWFPKVTISKYSPDQTEYAERMVRAEASWYRRLFGRYSRVEGDLLRRLCGEPEDGYAYDAGNALVNVGLNKLALWACGSTYGALLGAGSGTPAANAYCAVGDGTTAWAATQTDLQGVNKYYNTIDSGYPTANASSTPGLITVQSTFGGSVANGYGWNEWAWGTSTGSVTPGTAQPTTGTNDSLWNRKVPSSTLGTKGSGASWVFTTTIQFS